MTSPHSIGFGPAGPARRDAMVVAHEGLVLANTANVHATAAQARADAAHDLATSAGGAASTAQSRADEAHSLATTGNTTANNALSLAGTKAQIVAFNTTTTSSPRSDVEQLMSGLSITVDLKAGRFYLFVGFGFEAQTDTGDNLLMRLRHTTDGSAVTLTSSRMKESLFWPTRISFASDQVFFHLYRGPLSALTLKAQLTIEPINGATQGRLFNGHGAVLMLLDLGPAMPTSP